MAASLKKTPAKKKAEIIHSNRAKSKKAMANKNPRATIRSYTKPRSVCACTHDGDGPQSQHRGTSGHGACLVKGCKCTKFTWCGFLPEYCRAYEENRTD